MSFSPSADDPYTFGQIAAANSLSDVYAMGGRPITALSIVGFPIHSAPDDALHEILRGGIDKMAEAGVAVVGGHSINDQRDQGRLRRNRTDPSRQDRDQRRRSAGRSADSDQAAGHGHHDVRRADRPRAGGRARSRRTVDGRAQPRRGAKLMIECGAHACTDVTGFGLMGHLGAMAAASKVDVEIVWDDLPLLPGVLECLAEGIASGAVERNRESSAGCLMADENVAAGHARPVFRSADFRRAVDRRCRSRPRTICLGDCTRRACPRRRSSAIASHVGAGRCGFAPTADERSPAEPASRKTTTSNTGDD